MLRSLRRWWHYIATKLGMTLDEVADPKVQLEQAIATGREQHRKLTEQAALVVANQLQLQMRLDRAMDELAKETASAKQALLLADGAAKGGDLSKAGGFNQAAEAFAGKSVGLEQQIDEMKTALLVAAQASDQAKQAVALNAQALQKQIAERQRLLSQLDQAKMQEQVNAAMAQLKATAGDEAPTLDEVRNKIERRLTEARATSEISGGTVDQRMLEVEAAKTQAQTEARLADLRSQLGLPSGADPVVVVRPAEQKVLSSGDEAPSDR